MTITFILKEKDGSKKKFRLKEGQFLIIGRSETGAQVTTKDVLCSGKHCKIFIKFGKIYIKDLGSKNGVFLNEFRVMEEQFFLEDKVRIGHAEISIKEDSISEDDFKKVSKAFAKPTNSSSGSMLGDSASDGNNSSLYLEKAKSKNKVKGRKEIQADNITNKENRLLISRKKLNFLVSIATLIDYFVTSLIVVVLIAISNFFEPYISDLFAGALDYSKILKSSGLYYIVGSLLIGFIFHRLNVRRESGSIGEKVTGLAKNF